MANNRSLHDRDYRSEAIRLIREGKNQTDSAIRLAKYQQALLSFTNIKHPNAIDYSCLASIHLYLGNEYFNRYDPSNVFDTKSVENFKLAVDAYLQGIAVMKTLNESEDLDFRILTELHLNLSDAYAHLGNLSSDQSSQAYYNEASAYAFGEAIHSFKQIKIRTPEELTIGNPEQNIKLFHDVWERITSTKKYLNLGVYEKNSKQILETHLAFQGINDATRLLSNVSIGNPSQPSQTNNNLLFSQSVLDENYRNIAQEHYRQAVDYHQRGEQDTALNHYQFAFGAIQLIKNKKPLDDQAVAIIQTAVNEINLRQQLQQMSINSRTLGGP